MASKGRLTKGRLTKGRLSKGRLSNEMRTVLLFLALIGSSLACQSMYQWLKCGQDEEMFVLDVVPKCDKLNCTITCSSGTCEQTKPDCEIQCPDDMCNTDDCPECESLCAVPDCSGTCEVVCQPTSCGWKVNKPEIRPSNTCVLNITQEPACLYENGASQLESFLYALVFKLM